MTIKSSEIKDWCFAITEMRKKVCPAACEQGYSEVIAVADYVSDFLYNQFVKELMGKEDIANEFLNASVYLPNQFDKVLEELRSKL